MRSVIQRVSRASVTVEGDVVGAIDQGLCVLVGVTHDDTEAEALRLADKLAKLRIFEDDDGKMNRSVLDIGGAVLVISQFTLYGDARKGNRPGFTEAADPEVASPLIDRVAARLGELDVPVSTGRFGADMTVDLVNDGPVTIVLELP